MVGKMQRVPFQAGFVQWEVASTGVKHRDERDKGDFKKT
jgi:hypothetical protein